MKFYCSSPRRLAAVKAAGVLNGIEYVEVSDSEAPELGLRQRTLFVHLLQPPVGLDADNVTVAGGDRVPQIGIEWAYPANTLPAGEDPTLIDTITDPDTVLVVRTDRRGDFSYYTLSLTVPGGEEPPAGFDPLLNKVDFSFKVECESEFDCRQGKPCPRHSRKPPEIDYLAKDYQSFRRIMLDRLSLLAPDWKERNPADLGLALVEALAYLGDELSYRQDAVATEAYLETARRRSSLRRHSRLVDYQIHEGVNARVWASVEPGTAGVVVPAGTPLLTRIEGLPDRFEPGGREHREAVRLGAETFETVDETIVYQSHQRFDFWTWGDAGCRLKKGATSATLLGDHPTLKAGDVLVLIEVVSPSTGASADADPGHRVAVRLTSVTPAVDPSGGLFADPPTNDPAEVTEIRWDPDDAIPFTLCISAEHLPGVAISEARGNILLADHGRTMEGEDLGTVPESVLTVPDSGCDPCDPPTGTMIPARFRPRLDESPLTHSLPGPTRKITERISTPGLEAELDSLTVGVELESALRSYGFVFDAGTPEVRGGHGWWSVSDGETVVGIRLDAGVLTLFARQPAASTVLSAEVRAALPALTLEDENLVGTETWHPRADLLGSSGDAREFVVEMEHDLSAMIRFGDGTHGRRPDPGTRFTAVYRVGNGRRGNIGLESLGHIASNDGDLLSATNLLVAAGGVDPEAADAIRRDAPEAFLTQRRAVTEDDYEMWTERHRGVDRAAATFRWTGSWHTVFVTADRSGGLAVDDPFEFDVRDFLEPVRMAGYDLKVDGPEFVPLDIALFVCVDKAHFRAYVLQAVLDRLSSSYRADGSKGLFHPDRFTFAQPVYLSEIVAAAQDVEGVESVQALRFQRQRDESTSALDTGVLDMGRLEIARLDTNPNFPERGVLEVTVGGGK